MTAVGRNSDRERARVSTGTSSSCFSLIAPLDSFFSPRHAAVISVFHQHATFVVHPSVVRPESRGRPPHSPMADSPAPSQFSDTKKETR
ncbi:Protein kinase domain-containing protein [Psidium guajava]|nr:Protein kinase domain-containing protein [Psidium guajava]